MRIKQKEKIVLLLRAGSAMTQGELAEAIYGDSFHTPNIYSALMGLVNEKVIMRLDGYPARYSIYGTSAIQQTARQDCAEQASCDEIKHQTMTMSAECAVNLSQVARLTGKIADKTLEQLEREGVFVFPETVKDAEDITQDQMILQSVNDTYRSGNVMGFLGYGDERLVIASRFCGEGEDYFFQYLLDKVLDFPNIVDLDADANQDNRLFNFLLFLFPYYLKAAMRKGLFKKYIRHRYNDGNVKGTIDVARHIEKNTPFVGNVAYSQREFSYDNSLMELVRHTVEFIKRNLNTS